MIKNLGITLLIFLRIWRIPRKRRWSKMFEEHFLRLAWWPRRKEILEVKMVYFMIFHSWIFRCFRMLKINESPRHRNPNEYWNSKSCFLKAKQRNFEKSSRLLSINNPTVWQSIPDRWKRDRQKRVSAKRCWA